MRNLLSAIVLVPALIACSGNEASAPATGTAPGSGGASGGSSSTSADLTGGASAAGGREQTTSTSGATSTGGATGSGGSTGFGGSTGSGGIIPGVRYTGRYDASDPNAVKFAWSGGGVMAIVTGSTIAVSLGATSETYYMPVVDGIPGTRFSVSGGQKTYTIGSGLSAGDHTVELYREYEGMYGVSTFYGFTSGTVKGSPASNGRLVEVVGDSISAGYGNLGSETHPASAGWSCGSACCHETAANTSWYATYAAVAGHALGAEVSTVAHSGWGLYQDPSCNTNSVLPKEYDNALGSNASPAWDFKTKASVVVINLGTNDSGCSSFVGANYTTAGIAFVEHIRTKYPDAWIFFTIGSMGTPAAIKDAQAAIVTARKNAGDSKITSFDLGSQSTGADGMTPTGCDWHPNAADHARMAGILKTQLQEKLRW